MSGKRSMVILGKFWNQILSTYTIPRGIKLNWSITMPMGIWCQKLFTKAPWIIQCGFSPPIALKRIATNLISVDVSHPANLRGFFIAENL